MSLPIFVPTGAGFMPTESAVGPWDPGSLHGGAPAALLAHALGRVESDVPMTWARFSVDLLRPVPLRELSVETRVTRAGKKVQVLEATLGAGGQELARAAALRIRREALDPPAEGGPASSLPPPEESDESTALSRVPFGAAMDVRVARGELTRPGPAAVWFRLRVPVVEGEADTPLMRVAAAADFGNGISRVFDFTTHVFINPEVTIHLHREPEGEWVGLDARTAIGPSGVGLAESVLHDTRGPVGRAAQSLLVGVRNSLARM